MKENNMNVTEVMENDAVEKALRSLMAIMNEYDNGEMDREDTHYFGDSAIIEFIRNIGYDNVADAWEKLPKWYS